MVAAYVWELERAGDMATTQAYMTAALVRSKKRMPTLKSLLRKKTDRRRPQTPEEQRLAWLAVADSLGLKVTKHDKPVM